MYATLPRISHSSLPHRYVSVYLVNICHQMEHVMIFPYALPTTVAVPLVSPMSVPCVTLLVDLSQTVPTVYAKPLSIMMVSHANNATSANLPVPNVSLPLFV